VRILLADDEVLSNTALRVMIEEGGKYQVNPFFNGLDLCKFYEEQNDVSAVILDLEMPERNGIETAKWIRDYTLLNYELDEHKRRVPIIGITGHESEEIKAACINAGMDKVLSKPKNKRKLMGVLKSII
jgi:CheY-like chemotaxis protein